MGFGTARINNPRHLLTDPMQHAEAIGGMSGQPF